MMPENPRGPANECRSGEKMEKMVKNLGKMEKCRNFWGKWEKMEKFLDKMGLNGETYCMVLVGIGAATSWRYLIAFRRGHKERA